MSTKNDKADTREHKTWDARILRKPCSSHVRPLKKMPGDPLLKNLTARFKR